MQVCVRLCEMLNRRNDCTSILQNGIFVFSFYWQYLYVILGYLSCALFLKDSHELTTLLINTIHRVCSFTILCGILNSTPDGVVVLSAISI